MIKIALLIVNLLLTIPSISHCNVLSLDLNTSSTPNVLHASVDSLCISRTSSSTKFHDDMLALSCCHDKNACVPSNPCIINNVEETQLSMEQDGNLSSSLINYSSSSTILFFMAKSTGVMPNRYPHGYEAKPEYQGGPQWC